MNWKCQRLLYSLKIGCPVLVEVGQGPGHRRGWMWMWLSVCLLTTAEGVLQSLHVVKDNAHSWLEITATNSVLRTNYRNCRWIFGNWDKCRCVFWWRNCNNYILKSAPATEPRIGIAMMTVGTEVRSWADNTHMIIRGSLLMVVVWTNEDVSKRPDK